MVIRPTEIAAALTAGEYGEAGRQFGRPLELLLIFPQPYAVGMSNLGFLFAYCRLREYPELNVERAFLATDGELTPALESGRPWREFPLLAFSVAYEPDLLRLVAWAERVGLPLRAADRPAGPRLVFGGSGCQVNPRLLDGTADHLVPGRLEAGEAGLRAWLAGLLGCPPPPPLPAPDGIFGTVFSPRAVFADTLLIEVQRGCPFRCPFCWLAHRGGDGPPLPAARVLAVVDAHPRPKRVGLIAPCLTEYPELKPLLDGLRARGKEIGFASLRADRIDGDLLDRLAGCGLRTLTVAPETGSARLKAALGKPATAADLAALLTAAARRGIVRFRLYYLFGLPGETAADLEATVAEVTAAVRAVREAAPGARFEVTANPFVPKPGTPWADRPFAGAPGLRAAGSRLRAGLAPLGITVQVGAFREALRQHRLGIATVGLAALAAGGKTRPGGL